MKTQKTTIAFIKRLAKKLKKESRISHTKALDEISIQFGYANFKHCSRMLSQELVDDIRAVAALPHVSFTEWLTRHKSRNSPLGDLATDMLRDSSWPLYDTLDSYQEHLSFKNASSEASEALGRAWKSYKAHLKRRESPVIIKEKTKKTVDPKQDQRKIVFVGKTTPVHILKRIPERFNPGDKGWISWDGRKAIPVTIVEADANNYSVRVERPRKKAGNQHSLFSDEVRSTPELACMNCVSN